MASEIVIQARHSTSKRRVQKIVELGARSIEIKARENASQSDWHRSNNRSRRSPKARPRSASPDGPQLRQEFARVRDQRQGTVKTILIADPPPVEQGSRASAGQRESGPVPQPQSAATR